MQAFRFGLSFNCKLTLRLIQPFCLRLYVLFSLFGDTIQLFDSFRKGGVASRLVLPCSTFLCRPSVDCLHNLSEADISFQEPHRKEMSEFNSLIEVVSCAEILCWSFLQRINYFYFDLCVQNMQVCFSAFRLDLVGTNLYSLI